VLNSHQCFEIQLEVALTSRWRYPQGDGPPRLQGQDFSRSLL